MMELLSTKLLIPRSPRCVTWLSLEAADNDPVRFWTYVIASIQQIHPVLGAGPLSLLQSPQSPPIDMHYIQFAVACFLAEIQVSRGHLS